MRGCKTTPESPTQTLGVAVKTIGRWLVVMCGAICVGGAFGGWLYAGQFGLLSGCVAGLISIVLCSITYGIDRIIMAHIDVATSMIFGSYVVKLAVVLAVVITSKKWEVFEPGVMFVSLVVAIIGASLVQAYFLGKVHVMSDTDKRM
ncbi:MAG: hypothetical protein Q4P66_06045 [Actinomycetaceae bacterium]|nr:hypothetical protein [Actinomycetaceae bacterium]